MTPNEGIHLDVPFDDYRGWDAVGVHDLMLVNRSLAHFTNSRENPIAPTDAMRFGTAAHSWILTPELAPDEVMVAPKIDRRTKAGKEAWADFQAMSASKTIVSEEEAHHLAKMANAVATSPAARNLLDQAPLREVSFLRTDPEADVVCRGRADAMAPDCSWIVDLKTTVNASPGEFARTAAKFNYHAQAAFYLDHLTALTEHDSDPPANHLPTFMFVVVEKLPPYGVGVYYLDAEAIEAGRTLYRRALNSYSTYAKGQMLTAGYNSSVIPDEISLPRWAIHAAE